MLSIILGACAFGAPATPEPEGYASTLAAALKTRSRRPRENADAIPRTTTKTETVAQTVTTNATITPKRSSKAYAAAA